MFTFTWLYKSSEGSINCLKLVTLKGALSGLRQFLATESPVKVMKNALFVLKIFKFLSWHFSHVEETAWLEK